MSDLSRVLLKADTRLKYKRGRNLAEIRQWYYQQSPSARQMFKEKLQALANASEWFDGAFVPITVALHLEQTWHSQDGDDSISLKADATPANVLAAIVQWDGADEDEKTWSIG